ncbi:MAG TPA: serine/threonine protein kinase [Verrucomicrobia bacterium]|jgi:outer membrane protein assembly factor BamB|nr:serine/threonine protein kinase [Verrucomicrobiota bacterium]
MQLIRYELQYTLKSLYDKKMKARKILSSAFAIIITFTTGNQHAKGNDWTQWRGLKHDGIADSNQDPPIKFSSKENVIWSTKVPGRGHGSPTIYGDRIFLATADEKVKTQTLICLNRLNGKEIWSKEVHRGGFPQKSNKKASQASSTPATDGKLVYINFLNKGIVYTTAFDYNGNKIWQQKISDYILHQGFSTSPAIYKSLVIVSADNKSGGAICGLNRSNGKVVWKVDRPKEPNYTSPVIYELNGRDELVFQGCNLVTSLDPNTGKKFWEISGSTTECVSSIVTDGKRVFTSGGYPRNHVSAISADGSGKVIWENISRVYVPSMIVKNGYLYAVMDNGNAMCWNSETGKNMWKERLNRTTSASPVMVGERIYAVDENGNFSVFAADPKKFKVIAKNKLGDQVFATPVICDSKIFARVAENVGDVRQEVLYCIGKK